MKKIRKTILEISEGIKFIDSDPREVKGHLELINQSRLDVNPSSLKLVSDGNSLVLQVMNGKVRQFPIRKTFLYKLLNWYRFPLAQLHKLSAESVASICNDYLMNIKRQYVTVKFEKDEALTLLSPDYNEITDLEIIRACENLGLHKISRNDFFLSINTEIKLKTKPVPDDQCGVGLNIVNSETGFRALTVSHYILRYTCSNGAFARISDDDDDKRCHYGKDDLKAFLNDKVERASKERGTIIEKLQALNQNKINKTKEYYIRKIEHVLGRREAFDFFENLEENVTQYDLFNFITSNAKRFDLSKRYFLESFAGSLIFN